MNATTKDVRQFGATRALLATLTAAAAIPVWLACPPRSPGARRIERRFFTRLLRGAGISVESRGSPAPASGTLYVVNHISWADILVLATRIEADFVAKADVAGWPLIGLLARRMGPIFVAREQRGAAAAQADAVRARLAGGGGVILFPEGTTSDGSGLLPFRTSLFAATQAARRIQPVALAYVAADGSPLSPERLAEISWVGGEALLPHAARLVRRPTRAVLTFLDPLDPSSFADRKMLAEAARSAIAAAYATTRPA